MIARIDEFIQKECRLNREQPIIVGVSGGPDSLCLVDVLWRRTYPTIAAYFNHHLRPEAIQEAKFVKDLADSKGFVFIQGEGDVAAFSSDNKLSVEEAARTMRYRFLFDQAEKHKAQAVAVGHTADDQVETVLMHLLRGTGLEGLKGILPWTLLPIWSKEIPLVRPLLSIWRTEVLDYCQQNDLQPLYDKSNLDTTYFRNRIRHELLPYLEDYNPRIREGILRMSQVLAKDFEVLDKLVFQAWRRCVETEGGNFIGFTLAPFLEYPEGIQRRLLRKGVQTLQPTIRDLDFNAVKRALSSLESETPSNKKIELVAGFQLFIEGERIWIARKETDLPTQLWPQMPGEKPLKLEIPGSVSLDGNWRINVETFNRPEGDNVNVSAQEDPFQVWIDAERITKSFTIRGRQPGDRFRPLGMGGHSIKVSDLMINVKVPRRARDKWPLVCSEGEIVWIPCHRLNHHFRVTNETRYFMRIRLNRETS